MSFNVYMLKLMTKRKKLYIIPILPFHLQIPLPHITYASEA